MTLRSVSTRRELSIHQGGQEFQSLFKYFVIIGMTVSKCSACFVPLCAILPLQDKTSHALQLQPCFTKHKSGCVFQVIHPPNKTKVLRHVKFHLSQMFAHPKREAYSQNIPSRPKNN